MKTKSHGNCNRQRHTGMATPCLAILLLLSALANEGVMAATPATGEDMSSAELPAKEVLPGDAPPEDAPAGDAPPEDAPPGDAPPEDAPPEDAPPGDAPPEDAPPEEASPGEASFTETPPEDNVVAREKTGNDKDSEPAVTGETVDAPAPLQPDPPPSPDDNSSTTVAITPQQSDLGEVIALLKQQQQELADQKAMLAAQSKQLQTQAATLQAQALQLKTLSQELDVLREPLATTANQQVAVIPVKPKEEVIPKEAQDQADAASTLTEKEEVTGEAIAAAQTDDPTRALLEEFKGAWRLPGTKAALAIGGYVKSTIVYNFDPLEIKDRFIVGAIPVGMEAEAGAEAQSSITASQSRLNFDLRDPTEFGVMRAFIEGDFAGDNDTFRLRHAFGQWNKLLAGKTWSAFVDTSASPEEVDFEGLNGRINMRQSQVRLMPTIGQEYEFQFSLEDPNPQVQNGQGVTKLPDLVMSARFQLQERLHLKAAIVGRQIRAKNTLQGGGSDLDKKNAWGISLSGRFYTPRFDERDSLLFQLNAGNGIGRYVNDLSSVGNFDGIFNPNNGNLELFEVQSGYVSLQHWWGYKTMRSNFTLGLVNVDNPGFVDDDAYKQTIRFSSNLFWSPIPRIDVGGEYLWGLRENEGGEDGNAQQIQLALRYRF